MIITFNEFNNASMGFQRHPKFHAHLASHSVLPMVDLRKYDEIIKATQDLVSPECALTSHSDMQNYSKDNICNG